MESCPQTKYFPTENCWHFSRENELEFHQKIAHDNGIGQQLENGSGKAFILYSPQPNKWAECTALRCFEDTGRNGRRALGHRCRLLAPAGWPSMTDDPCLGKLDPINTTHTIISFVSLNWKSRNVVSKSLVAWLVFQFFFFFLKKRAHFFSSLTWNSS